MGRLQNKSALITGGGAGIGAACARLFCAEGAAVTLVDLNATALEETAQAIRARQPEARITYFEADVADADAAEQAVLHAVREHGQLDVLVNNAAMRNYSSLADATPEEWQKMLQVNLIGGANFCRQALPFLRKSGKGSVVNVASCYAVVGRTGMGIYDATKAAQLAVTRTLAHEEAEHGIRVNVVCPGSTLTEFHVARATNKGKSVEQLKTERTDTSLLGRWAHPDEIAWPVLWLASDEASYITGATIMVDGGLSAM